MKQSLVCVFLPPMIAALSAAAAPSDQMARTVVLDEIAVKNLGLETVEAGETTFAHTVLALGQIEVLPGKTAVLSSRVAGRAQTVIALPDMICAEGDELVWMESRQAGDPPPVVRLDAPRGAEVRQGQLNGSSLLFRSVCG